MNTTLSKIESFLIVNCTDVTYLEDEYITCLVPSDATGTVTITVDGNNYSSEVQNGSAEFTISGLTPGTKTASAIYSGDLIYTSTTATSTFIISKAYLSDEDVKVIDFENGIVGVVMPEGVTGTVNLKYQDSIIQTRTLNNESYCEFDVTNLLPTPGTLVVAIEYLGDQYYSAHTQDAVIEVPKYYTEMTVEAQDSTVGEDIPVTITLPAGATGNVTLEIDGKKYTYTVYYSGTTTVTIPGGILAGTKTIIADYSGDDNYLSQHTTATVVVSKVQPSFVVKIPKARAGKDIIIKHNLSKDATGTVTAEISGISYTADVVNGEASVVIPKGLSAGSYSVKSTYPGDYKYESIESTNILSVS